MSSRVKNLFWSMWGGCRFGIEDEASSSIGSMTWGSGVFSSTSIIMMLSRLVVEWVGECGAVSGAVSGEGLARCWRREVNGLNGSRGKRLGGWREDAPVAVSGVRGGFWGAGADFGGCCGIGFKEYCREYNMGDDGGAIKLW